MTVLIPAYSAAKTIRRALNSVFAQHYPNLEIIVIDDGSQDATGDVVRSYGKPEIRLVSLSKNGGVCAALNEGLAVAKGDYIAFLDADDEWRPTKLAKQIDALERNSAASFATCGCIFLNQMGRPLREFGILPPAFDKTRVWRLLLAKSVVAEPCVVARTSSIAQVGPFDTGLAVAGDQDMWIRLAMVGEVEFIPEYLVLAHDTPNSLTKVYARSVADYVLPMIQRHLAARETSFSRSELRNIWGERFTSIGRNLYANGNFFRGGTFILRAVVRGSRARENIWYLITASPIAKLLKHAMFEDLSQMYN